MASATSSGLPMGARHIGGDESRRHGIAAHALGRELARGRLCEPDEPRLGRRIVALAGVAHEPGHRADVDHAAAAVADEHAGTVAQHVERPLEVRVEHGVVVGLAHHGEQAVPGDPGVVHEDVHGAEIGLYPRDGLLHRGKRRDVALICPRRHAVLRTLGADLPGRSGVRRIDHGDVHAERRELQSGRPPYAARAARDYCSLPLQHAPTSPRYSA